MLCCSAKNPIMPKIMLKLLHQFLWFHFGSSKLCAHFLKVYNDKVFHEQLICKCVHAFKTYINLTARELAISLAYMYSTTTIMLKFNNLSYLTSTHVHIRDIEM